MKVSAAVIFTLFLTVSIFAQKQAEVVVTSTHVRKSPDIAAEKVQTLEKGEKVLLEKSRDTNGWFYVSLPEGNLKGWIRKDTIRAITNAQPIKTAAELSKPVTKPVVITVPPPTVKPKSSKTTATTPPSNPATAEKAVSSSAPANTTATATETTEAVEDPEILRIDTEEVSLNVRVVDGNNRPVHNLNQTHFKIYEDEVLQPITSMTISDVPIVNALVIDNSRSLRTQLGKVIEAGKIIVGTNREKDESLIVRFVSTDKIEVVQDFTPSKQMLNNALDNLFVEGGQTAIIDAVYRTAKRVEEYQNSRKKEDVKLRTLILVSDGDDRSSVYKEKQLFDLLRNSQVQIYAVGFINDLSKEPETAGAPSRYEKAKTFLTRLAQETGGKVYFPDSTDELAKIAADISREQHTQYLISYAPTNENRDGTFRKIRVEVAEGANKEKRIAITRTGRNSLPQTRE